jgi:hypothetical protein
MNADRRRHFDPSPRIEYAPVQGHCRLIPRNTFTYPALIALGFVPLVEEGDFALMQAPAGFEVAQERT